MLEIHMTIFAPWSRALVSMPLAKVPLVHGCVDPFPQNGVVGEPGITTLISPNSPKSEKERKNPWCHTYTVLNGGNKRGLLSLELSHGIMETTRDSGITNMIFCAGQITYLPVLET